MKHLTLVALAGWALAIRLTVAYFRLKRQLVRARDMLDTARILADPH